jgi:polyhydroxybutyrate depolymerase
MQLSARMKLTSVLLFGALLTSCSSTGGSNSGTGGSSETGGSSGDTGGSPGSGGSPGTGGSVGTGGSPATGGSVGTGGSPATGGSVGTGGSATGGTTGTGGKGGATGTGGSAGHPGTGGTSGTGGSAGHPGTGGSGTGGTAPGTGGTTGTGGSGTVTCPATVLKSGDQTITVQVPATTTGPTPGPAMSRTYILHVPTAYKGTSPVPLVVDYHPLGGSGSSEESGSPFKAQTDPEGVVTAYPNGKSGPSGGAWNVVGCCVSNVDDVAFSRALVAQVETMACIDTKRVYAVGFSMGGGMSEFLACVANDLFAAAAPQSFDLLTGNETFCAGRPISVISFRSTNDTLVNYTGGNSSVVSGMPINFLGAVGTFQFWAKFDSCTDTPAAADSHNCQYYKSCKGGVQLGLCTMSSGHNYGDATVGWPFIKQFTLP